MLLKDEKLQSIITSQVPYEMIRDVFDEVYSTINDKYLLISKELFHYIVGSMRATSNMMVPVDEKQVLVSERYYDFLTKGALSVEDIEALYGEKIIQRYFEKQKQENNAKRMNNLSKGNSVHRANAEFRKAQIISLVLDEYTKSEIEEILCISRSTVDRALRGLTPEQLDNLTAQYKDTVFCNINWNNHIIFYSVGCSYCKFRKRLSENRKMAENYER